MRRGKGVRLAPFLFLFIAAISCGPSRATPPKSKSTVLWSKLGQWSGRGNLQTESFIGATGYLRVTWETTHEEPSGAGRFKLTVGSSISGRPLAVMVDAHGAGHDVAYLSEDPRTFYALVDSADVDWKFTIDEGYPAAIQEK